MAFCIRRYGSIVLSMDAAIAMLCCAYNVLAWAPMDTVILKTFRAHMSAIARTHLHK